MMSALQDGAPAIDVSLTDAPAINWDRLRADTERFKTEWRSSAPFPVVVIDDFFDVGFAEQLLRDFPKPDSDPIRRSRDYMFAANKFEKSDVGGVSPAFGRLESDLLSTAFSELLTEITGIDLRLDDSFHGGGLHMGGAGSYLDMHTDFNVHPLRPTWRREANVLIYLNPNWRPAYGGELKLRRGSTGVERKVEPLFNRCVIMSTGDDTIHGYDRIAFPQGEYRRSIAAYAYSVSNAPQSAARSSVWYPEKGGAVKRLLGRAWPHLVRLKSCIVGSATAKNR
ncbi:MAG: 2OG-Fe(II) oxygenase [Pseudomonadota bacterium]